MLSSRSIHDPGLRGPLRHRPALDDLARLAADVRDAGVGCDRAGEADRVRAVRGVVGRIPAAVGASPRIAVDIQFGDGDVWNLRRQGFDVVVRAEHAEPDRDWFARAMAAGAEFVCSPDSDLEILAYDANVRFVKVPGSKRVDLCELVRRAWERTL